MQLSGAQIIVQSLKAEGVEYVFGYPGGAVIEIYDAIFQLNKFKHILARHEQAAVHAADAYSRVSGKVGVALVTSGPGVTKCVDRHCHRIQRLYSDGSHQRTGRQCAHRYGCVSRGGYGRHYPSVRQTQFLGNQCQRACRDH